MNNLVRAKSLEIVDDAPGSLHIDISRLNRVVRLELLTMRVTVQAGIRWFDLLRFLQPHGLSVRVMPAFVNFTVGGSISSNQASPNPGCGPVAEGVTALTIVLADGSVRTVRPEIDGDLFRAIVGGFGGFGVIVEVEVELTPTPGMFSQYAVCFDETNVNWEPSAETNKYYLHCNQQFSLRCCIFHSRVFQLFLQILKGKISV